MNSFLIHREALVQTTRTFSPDENIMIEKAKVQEEIYLKELERLMLRRPDLMMQEHNRADEVRQWNLINGIKIYKDGYQTR